LHPELGALAFDNPEILAAAEQFCPQARVILQQAFPQGSAGSAPELSGLIQTLLKQFTPIAASVPSTPSVPSSAQEEMLEQLECIGFPRSRTLPLVQRGLTIEQILETLFSQ